MNSHSECCPYICENQTEFGRCKTSVCINPEYNGFGSATNSYAHRYIGKDGQPIIRTPETHPYNFDTFFQYKDESFNPQTGEVIYSDRLYQWDAEKFDNCCLEVWGDTAQRFDDRTPDSINRFLNLYLGRDVKLTAVLQECNVSNGNPYWIFAYENYCE